MGEEKQNDFKSISHPTLAQMAQDKLGTAVRIALDAKENGHNEILPTVPAVEAPAPTQPTLEPTKVSQRGRIMVFQPTKERVTILKARVGKSYAGDWIHNVTNREGKEFLASTKQLKELV